MCVEVLQPTWRLELFAQQEVKMVDAIRWEIVLKRSTNGQLGLDHQDVFVIVE